MAKERGEEARWDQELEHPKHNNKDHGQFKVRDGKDNKAVKDNKVVKAQGKVRVRVKAKTKEEAKGAKDRPNSMTCSTA